MRAEWNEKEAQGIKENKEPNNAAAELKPASEAVNSRTVRVKNWVCNAKDKLEKHS